MDTFEIKKQILETAIKELDDKLRKKTLTLEDVENMLKTIIVNTYEKIYQEEKE